MNSYPSFGYDTVNKVGTQGHEYFSVPLKWRFSSHAIFGK